MSVSLKQIADGIKAINQKIVLSVLAVSLMSMFVAAPGYSDGLAIMRDPDTQLWKLLSMNDQVAAIRYDQGVEQMLLSINMPQANAQSALWIFPIPALPEKVSIVLMNGFPLFVGTDLVEEVPRTYKDAFSSMRMFHLLPLAFFQMSPLVCPIRPIGVDVHQRVEFSGVTSELVTARDGQALFEYVKQFSAVMPDQLLPMLDQYIGHEYSFVVTYISDFEKFQKGLLLKGAGPPRWMAGMVNALTVSVVFPSPKIFFPMRLTGIYGDREIPMKVFVIGHVTPVVPSEIRSHVKTSYNVKGFIYVRDQGDMFFKDVPQNFDYTTVSIVTPSKNLKDDLWMETIVPARVPVLKFFFEKSFVIILPFFFLFSGLASVCAGMIAYGRTRIRAGSFFILGLANCFTFVGLCAAVKCRRISRSLLNVPLSETKTMGWLRALASSLLIGCILWVLSCVFMNQDWSSWIFGISIFSLMASYVILFFANDRQARIYLMSFAIIFSALTYLGEGLVQLVSRMVLA